MCVCALCGFMANNEDCGTPSQISRSARGAYNNVTGSGVAAWRRGGVAAWWRGGVAAWRPQGGDVGM